MPSQMLSQERQREISHTHSHRHTHTHTDTHTETQTHAHRHTHSDTHTQTHTDTHTHTDTDTHTHRKGRCKQRQVLERQGHPPGSPPQAPETEGRGVHSPHKPPGGAPSPGPAQTSRPQN